MLVKAITFFQAEFYLVPKVPGCLLDLRELLFTVRKFLEEGVNRGMQIHRSVPFIHEIRRSNNIFVQIPNHNHIRKQKSKSSKANNSNNSLTPQFKCATFKKRNNSDELSSIPTKAEERSMI